MYVRRKLPSQGRFVLVPEQQRGSRNIVQEQILRAAAYQLSKMMIFVKQFVEDDAVLT
jgi:hypothetical protein